MPNLVYHRLEPIPVKKTTWLNKYDSDPDFVGRDQTLEDIEWQLKGKNHRVALAGIGGVGYSFVYSLVLRLSDGICQTESLESLFNTATDLGISFQRPISSGFTVAVSPGSRLITRGLRYLCRCLTGKIILWIHCGKSVTGSVMRGTVRG